MYTNRDIDAMIAVNFYGWIKENSGNREILVPPVGNELRGRKSKDWQPIGGGVEIPDYLPTFSTHHQGPPSLARKLSEIYGEGVQIKFIRKSDGWFCHMSSDRRSEVITGKNTSMLASLMCLRQIGLVIKEDEVEVA